MENLRENGPIERNANNNNNNQNNHINNNNLNNNNNNINNAEANNNENHNNNNNNNNNFPNFNLNNLNYNRFRHVLHTHELEFLLNKKYSKSLWEIINTLTFTKNCHKISFSIILFLIFCISYLIAFMNYRNSSIIIKLESEESYFEIIIWMINIVILIISWNFYLFLYTSVFGYEYSKNTNNNSIRSSFVEDFYKNTFGFFLFLYYFDNEILNNVIDNSFWALLGFEYSFIHYNLNHFFMEFYKELNSLTDFKSPDNKILKKVNCISIIFLICAILLIIFNYMIIEIMTFSYKFIFLSKGIFLVYKILELWKIFLDEYKFLESTMDMKEKIFFKNLRIKSYIELGSQIFVHFQFSSLLINGDGAPFYCNIIFIYFIAVLTLQIISYYKKYKEIKDYFLSLDESLQKIENISENEDECIICTEKMSTARKLVCNHNFHLICLTKWFENGHSSCPICRTDINLSEKIKKIIRNRIMAGNNNDENQNRNRIFSFSINSNLFSWLPNFSLRIIRFYNNNENNANVIVNNQNLNRINIINIQRPANNQRNN